MQDETKESSRVLSVRLPAYVWYQIEQICESRNYPMRSDLMVDLIKKAVRNEFESLP